MVDLVAVILLFGGGTLVLLAVSPIGRALAARIKGIPPAVPPAAAHDELHADLQDVRRELAELVERMDFMERLVAKSRDAERLARPSD